jgi:hypothetical protein
MNKIHKGKSLIIIGGIFIIVVFIIIIILIRIGGAYRFGLETFSLDDQISDVTHTERQKIRKITIKNKTDTGCMEVTPDGIIRIFAVCEKELSSARRVTDTRYILKLYKKLSETDITKLPKSSTTVCEGYTLILETDEDTKSVCLQNSSEGDNSGGNINGGGSGNSGEGIIDVIDDIITIIDQVIDNIPPTPTPSSSPIILTPTPDSESTTTTTPILLPSWGISPTPTTAAVQPFTCDFIDAFGKKRPYTISNVICSTEPSQAPSLLP